MTVAIWVLGLKKELSLSMVVRTTGLTYNIILLALSDHLPSPVVGAVVVKLHPESFCYIKASMLKDFYRARQLRMEGGWVGRHWWLAHVQPDEGLAFLSTDLKKIFLLHFWGRADHECTWSEINLRCKNLSLLLWYVMTYVWYGCSVNELQLHVQVSISAQSRYMHVWTRTKSIVGSLTY